MKITPGKKKFRTEIEGGSELKRNEYPFYLLLGNWKVNHDVKLSILVLCPVSLIKVSGGN